ncbi:hypothetical protein N7495_008367 [Penicillium taxi]|uniref:uncharacterized protein n=1 Tax=Penicillium taxi TaxID=168475 RepID=UPI0025454A38|nr:uncharacterized protein N7495_008367 [Penicillium taxi]KAJ5888326.1 hypothetical protein N7495_008367 [Penicillium taxi]
MAQCMPPPRPKSRTPKKSVMSATRSESNNSGVFSSAVQNEVRNKSESRCWVCRSLNPEIAHVIGKQDRQTGLWTEVGLITFELTSIFNGIALCPLCHDQFDCDGDQGLVIVPTDLEFLVAHEHKDQERRTTTEIGSPRKVPTNIVYSDQGGQFKPIFLKQYLGPHFNYKNAIYSRIWHGAPIAMLRRCMMALGSARVSVINKDIRQHLVELQTLYFEEHTVNTISINRINIQEADLGPSNEGNPKEGEQQPSGGEANNKKRPTSHEGSPSEKRIKIGNEDGQINMNPSENIVLSCSQEYQGWVLGPGSRAVDAIERWSYMF